MPCLFLLLVLAFPRIGLIILWFTHYLDPLLTRSALLVILGFLFLPITTLVAAWLVHSGLPLGGGNLLWLVLAALVDLGSHGWGYSRRGA
jgi:hypothetical protein